MVLHRATRHESKGQNWKWGGLLHDGVLYGPNIMGYLIHMFRDMSQPIIEVVHKSTLEVVDEKFKKARRMKDIVVDLSDTPATGVQGTPV